MVADSLLQTAARIRSREVSPSQLVADCLDRIDRWDPQVGAWVVVDRPGAERAAVRAEAELRSGADRGPLHGIPVAIKDIVDVLGMPTRAGSPLTSAQPAAADATVVERLRAAGAIVLGKTVTTEFACFDPSPTRNPWNLGHTPGGSSSGSAAAVALGMCLGAVASQTGGSITRPASFCGVAGVKPTMGRVSRRGVVPVAFHLDHVGMIARSAADCATWLAAIAGDDPQDPASRPRADLRPLAKAGLSTQPPRLGVVRDYFLETAEPEVAALTAAAVARLADAGAMCVDAPLPDHFDRVHAWHRRIMAAEAADFHHRSFAAPPTGYAPHLASLLAEGREISMAEYQEALRGQVAFRQAVARMLAAIPGGVVALITPATPTAAPRGLDSTGDPRFNSPWSLAGVPTVSFPIALTAQGLPVALQLVGAHWTEASLLAAASWCERAIGFAELPPFGRQG